MIPTQTTQSESAVTTDFSGLWIPLVTPFTKAASDAVGHTALANLICHFKSCDVSGFVACGTTGEAAALSKVEQLAVLVNVLAHADRLPVLMGVSGYHLGEAIACAQAACNQGVQGLLMAAPH
jgi:4-hydroxy-tetrahydrodipicolinate synthase